MKYITLQQYTITNHIIHQFQQYNITYHIMHHITTVHYHLS